MAAALGLTPAVLATAATVAAPGASAQTETPLSETGWVASSNTNSSSGDAPQNAIDGNSSTRFSSDADQASGMRLQVNMGSAQTFNQIEMDSGGYAGDYARGYEIQVSGNGSTWTTVATGTGTSFQGYGMGSYSYFDQGVAIYSAMAFQASDTPGVVFHDLLTVFLAGSGGINSVINGTGAAVNSSNGGPSDVVTYP